MLPHHNGVFVQVGNIGASNALRVLLHDHPTEVGVEQSLADGIGVLVGVGIAVMGAVVTSPPADGTFNSTTADEGEPETKGEGGRIGAVSPQTVVA